MNIVVRQPRMTRDQFLDWAARREAPYEFDGFEPVPRTGGNRNHSGICRNLLLGLQSRLNGSSCEALPEAGVATIGDAAPDLTIFYRTEAGQQWTATRLSAGETPDLPEADISVPADNFYQDVELPPQAET